MSVPMTFYERPWKAGVEESQFLADLHNYARTVWPRMTKFGTVLQVDDKHILEGQPRTHPKRTGPSVPKIFWHPQRTGTPYTYPNGLT